jgi:hypothetical protein
VQCCTGGLELVRGTVEGDADKAAELERAVGDPDDAEELMVRRAKSLRT